MLGKGPLDLPASCMPPCSAGPDTDAGGAREGCSKPGDRLCPLFPRAFGGLIWDGDAHRGPNTQKAWGLLLRGGAFNWEQAGALPSDWGPWDRAAHSH